MTKKKEAKVKFKVRVFYGILEKLEIILLGEILSKKSIDATNASAEISLDSGSVVGEWEIKEILHMSFINQYSNPNLKGLVLKCKSKEDFKLLESLRVYDETVKIVKK